MTPVLMTESGRTNRPGAAGTARGMAPRSSLMRDQPTRGLCQCGCGEPTSISRQTARGRIAGQPNRFLIGHHRRKSAVEYVEEDRGYDTPCWVWQRGIDSGGYGELHGYASAHRAYYERAVGPIPEGLDLDHLCRVRPCVNPAHLEPVTRAENIRRGAGTKLTPNVVRAIRASDLSHAAAGRLYGLSGPYVGRIRAFAVWKDV